MNECTACGSEQVTIQMRVAEQELVFRRCSKCESNTWTCAAGDLTLPVLLDHLRAIRLGGSGGLRPHGARSR